MKVNEERAEEIVDELERLYFTRWRNDPKKVVRVDEMKKELAAILIGETT